jgi:hypothetical protein
MLTSAFRPLLAAALMVAFSAPALAAAGPQSFDQYPSFFELTSTTANGATAVLRCGYFSPSGRMVELDKGFHEISIINKAQKYYSRIQHIDNAIIATTSDPTGGAGLLLELVKPDGSTVAKNCQTDVNTDTIGNCRALKPFTFADQVKMGDEKIFPLPLRERIVFLSVFLLGKTLRKTW